MVVRHPGVNYIPVHAGLRSIYRQRETLKKDFLSPGPHRPGGALNFLSFEKVRLSLRRFDSSDTLGGFDGC